MASTYVMRAALAWIKKRNTWHLNSDVFHRSEVSIQYAQKKLDFDVQIKGSIDKQSVMKII